MDPQAFARPDEHAILKAFRNACQAPAYAKLLRQRGARPGDIKDLDTFLRKVPIVDKQTLFRDNELRELCVGGLDDVALFYSSSGATGTFSYGVDRRGEARHMADAVEFALDMNFDALSKSTLLINSLPMGVKIHLNGVALAETSVREDVIWSLVSKLKGDFDQFILVGEQMFLKKAIEGGAKRGIPWRDLRVHVVTGGEYVAENYRTYLASLLGIDCDDPSTGSILVNFGVSELAISLLTETADTVRIRRLAHRDPSFRERLYGRKTAVCPNLMQYFPSQAFVENKLDGEGRSSLVVTMLDPHRKLPVIRYDTGDLVEIVPYAKVRSALADAGRSDLVPDLPLPFAVATGKCRGPRAANGEMLSEQQVKEALYADLAIARQLTGNFRLTQANGQIGLAIQLAPGLLPGALSPSDLGASLRQFGAGNLEPIMLAYEEFPHGLTHDYERKCQYWAG